LTKLSAQDPEVHQLTAQVSQLLKPQAVLREPALAVPKSRRGAERRFGIALCFAARRHMAEARTHGDGARELAR
jgi:hypothetical protein